MKETDKVRRLQASAPDLLEALKEVTEALIESEWYEETEPLIINAKEAISKAET